MKKQSRPPLVRMYAIDGQLRNRRYPNCSSLAREFEVNPRTIRRDIDYMRDLLGAPIAYDFGQKGFHYLQDWAFIPSLFIEAQEAEALQLTKKVLSQYQGTPYYEEVRKAIDKVLQYLPETIASFHRHFDAYSFEEPAVSPAPLQFFAALEDGIRQSLKVRIIYDAPTTREVTERIVRPYRLHFADETWYLIAWCELRSEIRAFVVTRMHEVTLIDRHFEPDPAFNADGFISGMFRQQVGAAPEFVRIRFSAVLAPWIRERNWHGTQEIDEHEDGSLILSMTVSSLEAVKLWVLGYAEEAEVLEPDELRRMVRQSAQRTVGLYDADSSGSRG